MPVLSFAQGKVTRPNHNRNSQGSSPKKESVQEPTIGTLNGHDVESTSKCKISERVL